MVENTTFSRSLDILQRNMTANSLRRQVIANNLANSETPNFKRSVVNFESRFSRALASEKSSRSIGVTTHEKHIPFERSMDYREVEPRITLDYMTTAKNNGNNVDVERELLNAAENQMMYELMSSAVNHQFRQVNMVLR